MVDAEHFGGIRGQRRRSRRRLAKLPSTYRSSPVEVEVRAGEPRMLMLGPPAGKSMPAARVQRENAPLYRRLFRGFEPLLLCSSAAKYRSTALAEAALRL